MNFVRDVVLAADPETPALVELGPDGHRREHTFGAMAAAAARMAGRLEALGTARQDVVLTLLGSRADWVTVLLACFGTGRVALPCSEQLRPADLRHRLAVARPAALVADPRHRATIEAALDGSDLPVLYLPAPGGDGAAAGGDGAAAGGPGAAGPDDRGPGARRPDPAADGADPWVELAATDPCLVTFTSGTTGRPKAVLHGQRYLAGQRLQARHWLGARPGDLVWCTAATGWSKSARNTFIAPWLSGAATLLHDARFDPAQRLEIADRENVSVLCMAPTEYRIIAARGQLRRVPSLRSLVAAGEALDAPTLARWKEATGLTIRDGYGQTETGQLTANPVGAAAKPGSMGRPLPGVSCRLVDGELQVDPDTVPTFFLRYLGEEPPSGWWRTGDRVRQDADGYLYFEARADDVIISAGYRIGPAEVEAVLTAHPAVAEAAVIGVPDAERGQLVTAVVVLAPGFAGGPELAAELQAHAREQAAPYAYPRRVEFVGELPRTSSGKVRRAALRDGYGAR